MQHEAVNRTDIQLSGGCGEDIQKWETDLETFQLLGLGKL